MHSIMTSNEKHDGVTPTASTAFPSHLSRPFDENTKPFNNSNSNTLDHSKLASMLRECANYVERNQFHPIIYGALGALHAYAGDKSGSSPTAASSSMPTNGTTPSMLPKRDSTPPPPPRRPQPDGGESFVPTPSNRDVNNNAGGGGSRHLGGIGSLGKKVWGGISNQASKKDDKKVSQHLDDAEWCDEHFTMGCACKRDKTRSNVCNNADPSSPGDPTDDNKATTNPPSTNQAATPNTDTKPSFQRPINTTSNLIANGWIEQQRRSKMRIVWKEVLASLVSGRQPSEETTLWIQRQVTSVNGQAELEALHQIPMKWVEDISYLDFYGDHRFAIKVYNFHDEFHFRCGDESGAMNWVSTLRSAREGSLKREKEMQAQQQQQQQRVKGGEDFDASKGSHQPQQQQVPAAPVQETKRLSIKELRAIAHGAGYNTRGMERKDLEKIAREQGQMPSAAAPRAAAATPSPAPAAANEDEIRKAKQLSEQLEAENRRLEQERLEAEMRRQKKEEEERKRREAMELEEKRLRDEMNRRKAEELVAEAQARQRQQEEEAQRRKQQEEAEKRRQHQEEMERQRAEEMERRRREEERKAAEEERRRQEEMERRRQQEAAAALEAQRRIAQEQAEKLRRQQEQQAAEQRRRQQEQEEYRRRQEQAAQEHRKYQQSQQAWQRQNFQQQFSSQRFANQQQQQQQQPSSQQYPFNNNNTSNGPPPPPPPPNNNNTNNKYAKAMSEEAEQAAVTAIKRNILISWALQPPTLQTLRPIDQLVCTIHRVFPPAFGVPGHEYFQKWKPIAIQELQLTNAVMGNGVNEDKLKKAVRKIRFFLHPDKLPRDLNGEQEFMCKMLWDVTSDAWEEFCTRNDELDWVK